MPFKLGILEIVLLLAILYFVAIPLVFIFGYEPISDFWATITGEEGRKAPEKLTGLTHVKNLYNLAKETDRYRKLGFNITSLSFDVHIEPNGSANRAFCCLVSAKKNLSFYFFLNQEGITVSEGLPSCGGAISITNLQTLKNADELYQSILQKTNFSKWVRGRKIEGMELRYLPDKVLFTVKITPKTVTALGTIKFSSFEAEINPITAEILEVHMEERVST